MTPKILRALFVAYIAATVVHVGWVVAHEPFSFDAWNMAQDTSAHPITLGRFFDYWHLEYVHSNPRIGQALTYLAYKLELFAVFATPLAMLAISLAIVVLGTKRLPRTNRDLALWAIAIGALWFAMPQLGKTLFCRAYCANYVYGLAIQLWFLVPLRLSNDGRGSRGAAIAYAFAGAIAGLCNEHTGPTLCAFLVGYAWWTQRRIGERPLLAWAGAAGAIVGFAGIFFAPGQGERYEGLAQKTGLVGRVIQHGFIGNLDILRDLMLAASPVLGLVAIVAITSREPLERRALRLLALAMVAATTMAMTIFASPKLGPRFYYAGMALLLAAWIGLVELHVKRLWPLLLLAVAASIYAGFRTIPLYAHVKRQSDARIAALEQTARGGVYVADAFEQIDESWWFLGDDFRDVRKREMVMKYFDLDAVILRGYDKDAPLGLLGGRFVAHAELSPPHELADFGGLGMAANRGFDVAGIHKEMQIGIAALRARIGDAARLDELELRVEFDGDHSHVPRPRILVARWWPDRFEGYVGQIVRKTAAHTRDIVLPKDMAGAAWEVYVYIVGGDAKRLGTAGGEALQYVPWATGIYWVLACKPDECFVIAATRQGGA